MQVIVVGVSVFAEETDLTSRSLPSFFQDESFLPRDKVFGADNSNPQRAFSLSHMMLVPRAPSIAAHHPSDVVRVDSRTSALRPSD
ncbi:hypothetical protein ALC57_11506 [Trachymyrmex cornetzi]|uniref:Uncharacterized protein n=1 Tax=Trachymyrmex cornetzi TaxID=471704 RepID=A0A195DTR3_9HYME|nr:hypothetical protein ALC57_11506 [Trachymyrmex cornetzi]